MKNKHLLRQITAAATAAVLAGTCMNIPVFAQQARQDASSPANSVFEMKDYSTVTESTEAIFNENAADFTSYGGSWKAGESVGFKNIDFATGEYQRIMLLISAQDDQAGKQIEVRLDQPDGELISTITVETTSDDENYFREHYGELASVSGIHDVYFVFPEEANLNFDWFTFTSYDGTETEEEKAERLKWWTEARFGQFIHFGAYSYLAGEYPPGSGKHVTGSAEWIMRKGNLSKEEYAEVAVNAFNPENFNAEKIVSQAKAAGQKYIVFTTRHHEGLSMFDTKVRDFKDFSLFSVANHGNYKGVDPVMELSKECKKQGLKFGTYISIYDWHDKSQSDYGRKVDMEQKDEYTYRLKAQLRELIETYGTELIWFDGEWEDWWDSDREECQALYDYVRSLNPNIITNNRVGDSIGDYGSPEQEIPETGQDGYWESCLTMTGEWGYSKFAKDYKDANDVVDELVKCVSGGGNCLMNIGPMGDGSITKQEQEALQGVGEWISKYGDSIYGAQANVLTGLPKGVKTTIKEGKMYIHIIEHQDGDIQIPNLSNEILSMKLMGTDQDVDYFTMKDKTLIKLGEIEQDPYDTVIEVTVDGMPTARPVINYALEADSVTASSVFSEKYNEKMAVDDDTSTRWATTNDTTEATFELSFEEPVTINTATMSQYTSDVNYVHAYTIDYWNGTEWATAYNGGNIGENDTVTFDPVTTTKVRFHFTDCSRPTFYEFGLYFKEKNEISITSPIQLGQTSANNETFTVLGTSPFTVSGTWESTFENVETVEVHPFQDGTEPKTFSGRVNQDGTWSVEIDQTFNDGNIEFSAYMKDADGVTLSVSDTITAIYRGYEDLALNKPTETSTEANNKYGGDKAVDGLTGSRWAPDDKEEHPVFTVDLEGKTEFNRIIIREMYDRWNPGYRCSNYTLEAYDGSEWATIQTGSSIGAELVLNFDEPITAEKLRLTTSGLKQNGKSYATSIETFEVYNTNAEQPEPAEEANKFNLKFYLDKANAVDQSVIESLVESAQAQFTAALENGQKVYDDATATQEEVDAAAKELRIALNMLSMVAGNKDALNDLISEAEELIANAGNNYPQSAIDALQEAIDAAKEVANDGDAFQADVDKAVEDLQDAIEAFNNSKLDWRALEAAVADAANILADKDSYVNDETAWTAFDTAYAAAQEMLNNKTADSQEAIDAATTALLEASAALRYKADKDTLNTVIGEAETVDVTLYTASSVANFKAALAAANTVAADESLSTDEQAVVDNAATALEEAMAALTPIDQATADGGDNNGSDDTAVAGGGEDTTGTTNGSTTATKTGDVNPLPLALAVITLAVGAGFAFRKKED